MQRLVKSSSSICRRYSTIADKSPLKFKSRDRSLCLLEDSFETRRLEIGDVLTDEEDRVVAVTAFSAKSKWFAIALTTEHNVSNTLFSSRNKLKINDLMGTFKADVKESSFTSKHILAEPPASRVRGKINQNLYTGVPAIELLFPIGSGQNMLIIGNDDPSFDDLLWSGLQRNTHYLDSCIRVSRESCIEGHNSEVDPSCEYFLRAHLEVSKCSQGKQQLIYLQDFEQLGELWNRACNLLDVGIDSDRVGLRHFYSSLLQRSAKFTAVEGNGSITLIQSVASSLGKVHCEELKSLSDGQVIISDIDSKIDIKNSFTRIGIGASGKQDNRHLLIKQAMPSIRLQFLSDLDQFKYTGVKGDSLNWQRLIEERSLLTPEEILKGKK